MANRRCIQILARHLKTLAPFPKTLAPSSSALLAPNPTHRIFRSNFRDCAQSAVFARHFSSKYSDSEDDGDVDDDDEEDGDEDDEDEYEGSDEEEGGVENVQGNRVLTPEDKKIEAAEIGYAVVGPLQKSDRVFKPYEPVFAVVQIGSHQFKVSNGDTLYVEKLKYCDVNDKLILNKVLMLGSETQTIIGRPILPDAAVHAVVEEHALDAKVIIFKKKRRKNYRRKNGHRQELTKLRITDIQGIQKPEMSTPLKKEKKAKPEKVAVEA